MTESSAAGSLSRRPTVTSIRGKLYNVRIEISVPGKRLQVGHTGPHNHTHEDIYVAMRDAFNAAGRLLEDHARRMRGEVKTHAEQ